MEFETKPLGENFDHLAPDCSEIRLLPEMRCGGLAHCTLRPGHTSKAVAHKSVEEIWYFLEGTGEVWRKQGERQEVTGVHRDLSLTIPVGTHFQFRNTGQVPLTFVVVTMPVWPGPDEAYWVDGPWQPTDCHEK